MAYALTQSPTPNGGGFGQSVPSPCRLVVIHWWGNPVGQDPAGIVSWLRNPISQVSAHAVVSPGRVTQLLPWTTPSWANGNTWANANSITLECDPTHVADTLPTIEDLLRDLVAQGVLAPDFELKGHKDFYATACPGAYYPLLSVIRAAVDNPVPEEDDEMLDLNQIIPTPNGDRTLGALLGFMETSSLSRTINDDWGRRIVDTPNGKRSRDALLGWTELKTVTDNVAAAVARSTGAAMSDIMAKAIAAGGGLTEDRLRAILDEQLSGLTVKVELPGVVGQSGTVA